MTLDELPGYLREIQARVATAVIPAANAMGETYQSEVRAEITKVSHVRPTRTPAPPGGPPAMESGALAASVTMIPASTPVVAVASVSPHRVYDWVQEYGATIHAKPGNRMIFDYGGDHYRAQVVKVPERPYLRPAVAKLVADGRLSAAAAKAFYEAVWG